MGQGRLTSITNFENMHIEADVQEGIAGGICYSDSAGVNLQVYFPCTVSQSVVYVQHWHRQRIYGKLPQLFLFHFVQDALECLSFSPEGQYPL